MLVHLEQRRRDLALHGNGPIHPPTSSSRLILTAPDTLLLRPWAENRCSDDAVAIAAFVARGLADRAAKLPPLKAARGGEERSAIENKAGHLRAPGNRLEAEIDDARNTENTMCWNERANRCCHVKTAR